MAESAVQNQGQSRRAAGPGRGRRRPQGRGGKGGARPKNAAPSSTNSATATSTAFTPDGEKTEVESGLKDIENPAAQSQADVQPDDDDAHQDEPDLCWICAEPIKYYAVSDCNHRTCHVCALRLRALYKKLDCTFCKEPQPIVVFTLSSDAPFSSYAPDTMPLKDEKLALSFETEEIMQESILLLRFNCPDSSCDYTATGWNDLKLHVRSTHKKFMCDLCITHKKVFSHEHVLYTPPQYFTHFPSAQRRLQKGAPKDQVEGGIHPLCEFCRDCFFGDDELFTHMRHSHEECFICKRNEIRDKYFQDYNALEKHFEQAHHPCPNPTCQAQKFVVFGSQIDLQVHMVDEHSAEMSSRDKKDARRVNAAFEFQAASSSSNVRRGGGPGGGGGSAPGRERGQRDSQPQIAQRPAPSSDNRRNLFGVHLTAERDATNTSPEPSRHQTPSPPPPSMDPVTAERYMAIFARLRTLSGHPANAVAGVKLALRDYTTSQSGARDLISTVWNTLDRDLDATASIINLVVDFLEDEEKKTDLLSAWNSFKIEQRREFPDLIVLPAGASTNYAGIANSTVLTVTSAHRAMQRRQAQRAVLDRVAQAAERGATFPPLRTPPYGQQPPSQGTTPLHAPQALPPGPTPGGRKRGTRNTAWSASAASVSAGSSGGNTSGGNTNSNSTPALSQGGKPPPAPPPPSLSNAAFPTLPSSAAPRARPVVSARSSQLQHILGSAPPATSAWAPGRPAQDEGVGARDAEEIVPPAEGAATGKKKGKTKQKQTLFMLGSYPSAGTGRQD